ncbi:MAG: aldo/keto reductase [Chloroflexota bacterium]|jgi:aryl-alcohol dehydrogenase-like predicted oxidoreductase
MIATQVFGRTGHMSTKTIFGAAALSNVDQYAADKTLELLIQHGINHIDTAASYGASEDRMKSWFSGGRRDRFFLATKTGERTYAAARDQIRMSLQRMGVDHIDLIQLHNLVDQAEWDVAMGPDGALKAAIEAQKAGLVTYIGVTGHGLPVAKRHFESLERYDFDSVLLPYSYMLMQNQQYSTDFERLLQRCRERNVAVQTIKAIVRRPWAEGVDRHSATWYEPLLEQDQIDTAAHWVLARKGLFLNTVGDVTILPKVFDAAERFVHAPSDLAMQQLLKLQEMAPLFTE